MPNDVLGNQLVAQGAAPDYTEAARLGTSWSCSLASAASPITAVPTTAALFELYNNSGVVGSPVDLIIDQIYAFNLLGVITVPSTAVLWAMVTTTRVAPTFSALTVFSNSGRASYIPTTGGRIITGVGGAAVVANGWRPYGNPQSHAVAAATPGQGWSADIKGRLIVPPGCELCLTVSAETISTNTYTMGASWIEAALPNMNGNQQ